jgi:hypothetical protein
MEKLIAPKYIFEKLPQFDVDVLAPTKRPWTTAKKHLTAIDDALNINWDGYGRIFCNPMGRDSQEWLSKCSLYGDCIALTYAKTESKQFQQIVFTHAKAVLFISGRPKFCHSDGTSTAPSPLPCVLIAFNQNTALDLEKSGIAGKFIWLKRYSELE